MNNSRNFGPVQVRDLSETLGNDTLKAVESHAPTALDPHPTECPSAQTPESHLSESSDSTPRLVRGTSASSRSALVVGSHVAHSTWIGAGFSPVKGSTPSTDNSEHDFSLAYIIAEVQRVDTVAA